jgi:hypothetical protein
MTSSFTLFDSYAFQTMAVLMTKMTKTDRLSKKRNVSDFLNSVHTQYYSPSENMAVDEVTVLFKG